MFRLSIWISSDCNWQVGRSICRFFRSGPIGFCPARKIMKNEMRALAESDFFENAARRMAASGLRQNNERAVLTALALNPGVPGVQLAKITGLGAQTISRILQVLENEHLITRGEPLRGQ